mmetsp:Transcript_11281/g.28536  ORF Transcript_11281/g.28536 Transcript_11281/m.28536 type:complete len:245 (+) Transcript_11281:447-1181(+)
MHSWSKGVEDSGNTDFNIALLFVRVHHGFCHTFALVVARTRANGVDITPVTLRLGVNLGISVNLAGGSKQDSGFHAFRESEHVEGSHRARLDGLYGIELVVGRRCGTSQVINLVDFGHERFGNIVRHEAKIGMMHPVSDVFLLSGEKIVNDGYFVALHHQLVNQMRTHKAGSAGYQNFLSSLITKDGGLHGIGSAIRRQRLCGQKFFVLNQSPHDLVSGQVSGVTVSCHVTKDILWRYCPTQGT